MQDRRDRLPCSFKSLTISSVINLIRCETDIHHQPYNTYTEIILAPCRGGSFFFKSILKQVNHPISTTENLTLFLSRTNKLK